MVSTAVEEPQVKKGAKAQKPGQDAPEPQPRSNPLEELRKQAEMAYDTYLGAQRKVARAYREREQAEVVTYKQLEEKANKDCDEAIREALAVRTEAEQSARQEYQKTLEKAAKVYEQSVADALRVCRDTIQQQWQVTNELSEQIWNIFQGDGGK